MELAVKELPITPEVKAALLGGDNNVRRVLNIVLNYEVGNWDVVDTLRLSPLMGRNHLMPLYVDALQWTVRQNY